MGFIRYWKDACLLACDQMIEWFGAHIVVDPSEKWTMKLYKDKSKEFRWRLVATNGKIICVSSEGYKTRQGAEHSFDIVRDNIKRAIRT